MSLDRGGLGPRSTAHVRAILRNALGRAERHGLVLRNAAALTEAVPVPNRERTVLTGDQARKLARALQGHRIEAAFALSMTLGLRQGEVLGLRWGDVGGADLRAFPPGLTPPPVIGVVAISTPGPAAIIHVRQTLQRAGGEYITGPPKTPRSRRDVPLPEVIASLLLARQTQQKAEFLSSGARPGGKPRSAGPLSMRRLG